MTPPELADSASQAVRELDELISTETVRTRHIQLVRTRSQVAALVAALTVDPDADPV